MICSLGLMIFKANSSYTKRERLLNKMSSLPFFIATPLIYRLRKKIDKNKKRLFTRPEGSNETVFFCSANMDYSAA